MRKTPEAVQIRSDASDSLETNIFPRRLQLVGSLSPLPNPETIHPSANFKDSLKSLLPYDLYEKAMEICADDQIKLRYLWLLSTNAPSESVFLMIESLHELGKSHLILEQLVRIAIELHPAKLRELLDAKQIYLKNLSRFSRFAQVVRRGGPFQIQFLRKAHLIYGESDFRFNAVADLILMKDGINKVLFMIKTLEAYGDDNNQFMKYLTIAQNSEQGFVSLFHELNRVKGKRDAIRDLIEGSSD